MLASRKEFLRFSVRHEDFHVSIQRPMLAVATIALAVTETMLLTMGHYHPVLLLLVLPPSVLGLCYALLKLLGLQYRFEVGPDGIDRYSWLLLKRHTSWDEIKEVHPIRVAGLDYLVVRGRREKERFWIPLFVTRYDLLRDLLLLYAGRMHRLDDKLREAA
ncbi:hypothetical protein [Planctomicrobium sp. SH664]|uniref:hypothetical protein n=1 Tax=Planctomicrobium sp. SH664 TaxID=3448125 RepID=UPI003F5BC821